MNDLDTSGWKTLYEDEGWTVEQISLEFGAYGEKVRSVLYDLGTEMRPVGGRAGKPKENSSVIAQDPHDAVVRTAFAGTRSAHRRRGRKA